MTATFEHTRKSEFALAAKAVSIKGAMAGVWPPAMIGLGLVLTLAWSGSLLWLFVALLVGAFVASLAATFGGSQRDA